jgi:ArsR family transcriptional regulator
MSIYDRLGTLGVPARVRMLRLLELEELQVGELGSVLQMPQSTVSRHLKALFDEGWLDRRREGTSTWFALATGLDEEARALWELVKSSTDGDHPEDGLRLASVLAARELDSRAFFGRVAGGWGELRRELFGEAYVLPALLALLPGDAIVADLGCGPGEVVAALAPWVGKVVGVDREPAMLDAARARLDAVRNVEVRAGVLEDPPLAPGELDAALLMLVLHHVEDPAAVARAVAPALKPGGRVVVVDMIAHDRDEYRRSMGHVHLGFDRDDVEAFAAAGRLRVQRHVVLPPAPEGTGPALFVAVLGRG